ncbi:MAG: hypothetical protein GXP59_07605 [Deltaproteobacteria bacterium]|nr:hypothetical protein [Deltaproteobacteria bacterium]
MTGYQNAKLFWSRDWLIKLISLFFAIFLWYFVAGEDRVDMNVRIPVEIVNLPRDLVISNQFKDVLDVTVSGPRSIIRDIARQHISRSIDLSHAAPGNIVIDNKNDSMSFPRGITVLRVQPSHIVLSLDRLIKKTIPVKYVTRGVPAAAYELAGIDLNPDQLTISGPQMLLNQESNIPTKAIDLNGLSNTITRQVFLKIPPAIADLTGEQSVTVRIKIKKKMVARRVGKIPIIVMGLAKNRRVRLETRIARVKIRLPLLMVNEYRNLKKLFRAEVNADLPPGRYELPVNVSGQPGIIIEEIVPPTVGITIR